MLYLISSLHYELVYTILPMHVPWILLKFHSGIFRLFRIAKNRKFRKNVVTARANQFLLCMAKCFLRAFVIVSLTFYSSMRQSYDTGCASSSDAQFHRTLLYIYTKHYNNHIADATCLWSGLKAPAVPCLPCRARYDVPVI